MHNFWRLVKNDVSWSKNWLMTRFHQINCAKQYLLVYYLRPILYCSFPRIAARVHSYLSCGDIEEQIGRRKKPIFGDNRRCGSRRWIMCNKWRKMTIQFSQFVLRNRVCSPSWRRLFSVAMRFVRLFEYLLFSYSHSLFLCV